MGKKKQKNKQQVVKKNVSTVSTVSTIIPQKETPADNGGRVAIKKIYRTIRFPDVVNVKVTFANGIKVAQDFLVSDFQYMTYWKDLEKDDLVFIHYLPDGSFSHIRLYINTIYSQ